MKNLIRKSLWKLLGIKYEKFLKNQKVTYLDDFPLATIGNHSYNNGAKVWKWNDASTLTIGNYCSIAHDVQFILDSGNHDVFKMTSFPIFQNLYDKEEVFIYNGTKYDRATFKESYVSFKHSIALANEVWIGSGVTILPGVSVGNGAIVLAGSVVTKSVEDFSVVGGIPAQHLYYRFPTAYHQDLLDIAWWNWDSTKIKRSVNDFELDTKEFILKHK